jgi:hypothetical protein
MQLTPSTCPCHAGETRDARLAFLDALIDAGWGAVPMFLIEREIHRNGGTLPPRSPSSWQMEGMLETSEM